MIDPGCKPALPAPFAVASAIALLLAAAVLVGAGAPVFAEDGDGVIRLGPKPADDPGAAADTDFGISRSGFDYRAFEGRLESLWFQRKTYLANGRADDAARQADRLVAFIQEEGIQRLPNLASALVAEAERSLERGETRNAEAALDFALRVDPGRPQTHWARAHLFWKSGGGMLRAVREVSLAVGTGFAQAVQDLTLINRIALVFVVAGVGAVLAFALLMFWRYQKLFRHDVRHAVEGPLPPTVAWAVGWGALFAPLVLWIGAGWLALFWIVAFFRYMRRAEKILACALLVATALLVPAYNMAVALYSMTADPQVRATIGSAQRSYDPNRILTLRRLVDASPDDPVYRFLLAGLYKDGRYFEDSFTEYREALKRNPRLYQAYINIGNIYYVTGNYNEAVANYLRALEVQPRSVLALYNMHLAQSDSFHFKEAQAALQRARELDPELVSSFLHVAEDGSRPRVRDATLQITSIWDAALGGRMPRTGLQGDAPEAAPVWQRVLNPLGGLALLGLALCGITAWGSDERRRSRECIRCGCAFHPQTMVRAADSRPDAREYCLQCRNLFLQGDGLAPGAKQRKMYEVERHEKRVRLARRLFSLLAPGSAQVLGGRVVFGAVLLLAWFAGAIAFRPGALVPVERALGLDLRLDLLAPGPVPAIYGVGAFALLGLALAATAWLVGNLWRRRGV